MMTVVGIIALLSAVATPQFIGSYNRSRENALRSNLAVVRSAVAMFYQDTGAFPNALSDLSALTAPANGKNRNGGTAIIAALDWRGPYLISVPNDNVSNAAFTYYTATSGINSVGTVRSSMTGNDSAGVAFSTY